MLKFIYKFFWNNNDEEFCFECKTSSMLEAKREFNKKYKNAGVISKIEIISVVK